MVIAVVGNSGSMGFNEIKKYLNGISSKTLSTTLKELEERELLVRSVVDSKPPTVRYSLTDSGFELRELLIPLLEWIIKKGGHSEEGCPIHVHDKFVNEDILEENQ